LFATGISATYIWLAILNALAIIPSMLRGKGVRRAGEVAPASHLALENGKVPPLP